MDSIENEQYEISGMVGALADILRYTVKNAGGTASISEPSCLWAGLCGSAPIFRNRGKDWRNSRRRPARNPRPHNLRRRPSRLAATGRPVVAGAADRRFSWQTD